MPCAQGAGQCIRATIPYIKSEIPILVLFRALGFVADRDILEHIVYKLELEQVRRCECYLMQQCLMQRCMVFSSQSTVLLPVCVFEMQPHHCLLQEDDETDDAYQTRVALLEAMLKMLTPSIEEAFPIESQEVALDYIGAQWHTAV